MLFFFKTLCRVQHQKTSAQGRGQNVPKNPVTIGKLRCFQTKEISVQSRENLMNNNSTRLPLLPPAPFALSLCSSRKWESFWKSSRRNALPVFETGPFDDSDNDEWFYGFHAEDIVLREAVADSDFDANEVSSVHTSDWSKWEQWWLGRRYRDWNGWSRRTRPIDDRFTVRTRINTDFDVADASQLDFFYRLFTPEIFATTAGQTNRYACVKFAAKLSLPCWK